MACQPDRYSYAICGFGPAGCGVTLAAARLGEFENMCDDGLCILESSERCGFGKLGGYLITANSPAGICVGPITPEAAGFGFKAVQSRGSFNPHNITTPIFHQMRSGPAYDALLKTHQESPLLKGTLEQYGLYCEEIANVMASSLRGKSKAYTRTRLERMQLLADGSFKLTASNERGHTLTIIAEKVALALGGKPRIPQGCYGKDPCYSADFIQRKEGLELVRQKAAEVITAGAKALKVMVVGGSHSAFSATQLLLNTLGHQLEVEMYHRGDIRVFFETEADAMKTGYTDYNQNQVCRKSGQVHRFGGIKSPVRELFMDVKAGRETRLSFIKISMEELMGQPSELFATGFEKADIVIVAMGYEANTVPLFNPTGTHLEWALSPADGQVEMDNSTAQPLVYLDGPNKPPKTLPNLYALGLGYGLTVGGAVNIGEEGVRVDGVGAYHTWAGDLVFRGMQKTVPAPVQQPPTAAVDRAAIKTFKPLVRKSVSLDVVFTIMCLVVRWGWGARRAPASKL